MDKKAIIKALRDTAQSASNSIAETVSAPVDALNWGLGKVGVNIDKPVLGSEWMAQNGLTAPVDDGIPKMAGEVIGNVGPLVAFAKAPQIASGMNRMVDNAMAPTVLNKQAGVVKTPFQIDKTRYEDAADYFDSVSMPEMEQLKSYAKKMVGVPKSFPGYDYELKKTIRQIIEEQFK